MSITEPEMVPVAKRRGRPPIKRDSEKSPAPENTDANEPSEARAKLAEAEDESSPKSKPRYRNSSVRWFMGEGLARETR